MLTGGQLSVLFMYSAIAIAPAFLASPESTSNDGPPRISPLVWWAAVLFVRVLPRLLPYAQPSQ
jgi:hypothetical protein